MRSFNIVPHRDQPGPLIHRGVPYACQGIPPGRNTGHIEIPLDREIPGAKKAARVLARLKKPLVPSKEPLVRRKQTSRVMLVPPFIAKVWGGGSTSLGRKWKTSAFAA